MGRLFLKIAVAYLFVGACVGFYMSVSENFLLMPVHAHLLLLGWASLALAGLIYHLYPAAGATRLAKVHFWLHNLGLPVAMLSLGMFLTGHTAFLPFMVTATTAVLVGLALFAFNVFTRLGSE